MALELSRPEKGNSLRAAGLADVEGTLPEILVEFLFPISL